MREIKFRAWDTSKHAYFIYFGSDYVFDDAQDTITFKCSNVLGDHDFDGTRFILQQYTGLKDKNGKESYHKDILRDILTKLIVTIEYGEYRCRNGTGYGWYLANDDEPYIPFPLDLSQWEVIGNCCENKELLKEE